MRLVRLLVVTTVALSVMPVWVKADEPAGRESAKDLSALAQKECDLGRRGKDRAARLEHFERGQRLAERAVALDERSAEGHFALFCSLGEQMRVDGESLTSVFGFRRMMGELDRTLELNPNHLDALSSKGTLLVRLPAVLGGDQERGERMLRHVIQRAPRAVNARLTLAKTCAARGEDDEALRLATEALRIARGEHREDLIPEAQSTVAEIQARHRGFFTARP